MGLAAVARPLKQSFKVLRQNQTEDSTRRWPLPEDRGQRILRLKPLPPAPVVITVQGISAKGWCKQPGRPASARSKGKKDKCKMLRAICGGSWDHFGDSWDPVWVILDALGAILDALECIWGALGVIFGALGVILGGLGISLGALRAILGALGTI